MERTHDQKGAPILVENLLLYHSRVPQFAVSQKRTPLIPICDCVPVNIRVPRQKSHLMLASALQVGLAHSLIERFVNGRRPTTGATQSAPRRLYLCEWDSLTGDLAG